MLHGRGATDHAGHGVARDGSGELRRSAECDRRGRRRGMRGRGKRADGVQGCQWLNAPAWRDRDRDALHVMGGVASAGDEDDRDRPTIVVRCLESWGSYRSGGVMIVMVMRREVPMHDGGMMVVLVRVHVFRRKDREPGQADDGGQCAQDPVQPRKHPRILVENAQSVKYVPHEVVGSSEKPRGQSALVIWLFAWRAGPSRREVIAVGRDSGGRPGPTCSKAWRPGPRSRYPSPPSGSVASAWPPAYREI